MKFMITVSLFLSLVIHAYSMQKFPEQHDRFCNDKHGELRYTHWDIKHVCPHLGLGGNMEYKEIKTWTAWNSVKDAWKCISHVWESAGTNLNGATINKSYKNRLEIYAPISTNFLNNIIINQNKGYEISSNNYLVTSCVGKTCKGTKIICIWNSKDNCWDLITAYPTV